MDFSSKNVIVTGAAGSIGYAIAEKFLSLGSKVLLTDINEDVLKEKCRILKEQYGDRAHCAKCDVTSAEMIAKAFDICNEKLGKANVLVNNAGGGNEKNFRMTSQLNLEAPVNGTEMAIKVMGTHEGGQGGNVVNISSSAGIKAQPLMPFYSTTKFGLVAYSRTVGHPFNSKRTGVKVQCICPSPVDTPLLHNVPKSISRDDDCHAELKKHFSTSKLLRPEEVASAIIELIQNGDSGAVMCIECDKALYYV